MRGNSGADIAPTAAEGSPHVVRQTLHHVPLMPPRFVLRSGFVPTPESRWGATSARHSYTPPYYEKAPDIPLSLRDDQRRFAGKKKALTTYVSAHSCPRHSERAPLCTQDSRPCNSPALHHEAIASRTRSTFSGHTSQWRYYPTAHAASTVSIVLTVPTAVGFSPKFLLGCCLTSPGKEVFTTHSHTASLNRIYL